MTYAHPGSIQVEVGGILAGIRLNVEQGDIIGIAKFTRLLVGTVAVYQEEHADIWEEIQAIPPFDWDKEETAAFEDEMRRRELCLRVLRRENIFGYIGAPPIGNSDALRQAIEEDDVEEVPV